MKALLLHKKGKFPKIHDLTNLARLVIAPQQIVELCAKLTPAYVATRYPDSPGKYTREECSKMIDYCEEVLEWTKKDLF